MAVQDRAWYPHERITGSLAAAARHAADARSLGRRGHVADAIPDGLVPGHHPARRCPRRPGRAGRLARRPDGPAGRPPHVVGHSFGGQVALDFALLVPQRVATLTLLCSRDTPFPAFAAAAARLRAGEPVDAGAALSRWFTPADLDRGGPVVRYVRRCLQRANRRSWAAAPDAIAGYDRAGRIASIAVPATLIAAEFDQVSTPAAMSALARRLPRAHLHVLPGAAHMTPFTDPAALAQLILRSAAPLCTLDRQQRQHCPRQKQGAGHAPASRPGPDWGAIHRVADGQIYRWRA
jgi:alpha-beta hydrolase superfamily lysophospholipase